jgi:ornithine carbamoyltransferase
MSIADVTPAEFTALVLNASRHKAAVRAAWEAGEKPKVLTGTLTGKTVAMMFSKRSTRTRVSTEAAVGIMGGNPMFLSKDDIQLGVSHSISGRHMLV